MGDFRHLKAWRESRRLARELNATFTSKRFRGFPGMRSQVLRAVDSIANNLAEGSGKDSPVEFARYAETAYASVKEVLNQLVLCSDRGLLHETEFDRLWQQADGVAALCYGLMRRGRSGQAQGKSDRSQKIDA